MKILGIAVASLSGVFALLLLFLHIKSRRPVRSEAINTALGIAALFTVNLTARFSGVYIPVNIYTLPGAALFGIPAVCVFVIIQMIV